MSSTVVKSTEPTGPELRIHAECAMPDRHPGTCVVNAREYPRAEVLGALGAVSLAYHDEIVGEANRQIHELEGKLAQMERRAVGAEQTERANRDKAQEFHDKLREAEATIERVGEALTDLEEGEYDAADCVDAIRAALDPKAAFLLPNRAGTEFWAMGPDEDYWTSFITFTDGTNVLYLEQETSVTIAFFPNELRERYNQFKPIEAMNEVAPGVATENGAE